MREDEKFREWCVVEIMGHRRYAGLVSEQAIGGASFVRVDVPEVVGFNGETLPAFSKLFGAASIYCLSPCTEETARAFAAEIRQRSFDLYSAQRLPAPVTPAPCDGVIPKPDDSDDSEYDNIDDMTVYEILASHNIPVAVPAVPAVPAWTPEVAAYPPPIEDDGQPF